MTVLVTGGAGYIGSHVCVELLAAGHDVVVFDNFSNSHPEALERVQRIAGRQLTVNYGDIRDVAAIEQTLRQHSCTAVMHFAGLKAVGDSVSDPLAYYDQNVIGTLRLLQAMHATQVLKLVFSSSATVYGEPQHLPLREAHPLSATNPYGRTKLIIEDMLRDLFCANPAWKIIMLRYFNPVGAHDSGLIGEDPCGKPNNLMPVIAQAAIGRRESVHIFGNDYATSDGTAVRDYIHVVDLARGHLNALNSLRDPQCAAFNLGTGRGYSVLEVLNAFSIAACRPISHVFAARRPGDIAECYADTTLAEMTLNWNATRNLATMCADAWRWQQRNPDGYASQKYHSNRQFD